MTDEDKNKVREFCELLCELNSLLDPPPLWHDWLERVYVQMPHVHNLLQKELSALGAPVAMLLWCPECGERHIDRGEFATKRHHTHSCQECGMTWRPAREHTVGVQFLPGYKDP